MKKPENDTDTVTVTAMELWLLKRDQFKLQCIENAGADNTDAYEYAMEAYHADEDYGDPDYR